MNAAFDLETRARPVLKWAGGKSSLLAQLVPEFPNTFQTYYEPFVGAGAVFLALQRPEVAVIADANAELINLYSVIRDSLPELLQKLDAMASDYSAEYYYAIRARVPQDKVAQAARTLFLNKTGFNGLYRTNSRGEFNVPFGKRPVCPALYDRGNIEQVAYRLTRAKLLHADFEQVLALAGPGDFVYCDPPYEPLSSTSSFTSYTRAGFTQECQSRLERACRAAAARGAMVAVSNSTSPFILSLYEDWSVRQIQAKRNINSNGQRRSAIAEIVASLGISAPYNS